MIIEIKDLPNGQTIDKLDIHIDFATGTQTVSSYPSHNQNVNMEVKQEVKQEVPQEMVDEEF